MSTTIRALIFDFDGLILDTETAELRVWERLYAEHGFKYPVDLWSQTVGLWYSTSFDPVRHLHELTHDSLNMEALRQRHREESALLIEREPAGKGVEEMLAAGRRRGLALAVASSSPRRWVEPHLTRLGLVRRFDQIVTSDDVAPGRTKPYPDIYLKAVERLGVRPAQAIAFEDSPPGVAAARTAGIFVIAVPNPTTAQLDLGRANMVLPSLAALSLDELLRRVSA